jgi:hypothetical protein
MKKYSLKSQEHPKTIRKFSFHINTFFNKISVNSDRKSAKSSENYSSLTLLWFAVNKVKGYLEN